MENHSDPYATAEPEEPRPPIVLQGLGPPDPPKPKRDDDAANAVDGAATACGRALEMEGSSGTPRDQPPSGPTWHDIIRQGGRFPGR